MPCTLTDSAARLPVFLAPTTHLEAGATSGRFGCGRPGGPARHQPGDQDPDRGADRNVTQIVTIEVDPRAGDRDREHPEKRRPLAPAPGEHGREGECVGYVARWKGSIRGFVFAVGAPAI